MADEDNHDQGKFLEGVKRKLATFFPEDAYSFTRQAVEDGLERGDFMVKASDILPYLQTALLDDKVLEVELDGLTRVYFSKVYDDIPDLIEEEIDGEVIIEEPDYSPGDYLQLMSHVVLLPLEPGMGNLAMRGSQRVMIRLFTTSSAIELGMFFQDMALVRDLPVLRLGFPVIARQVRGTRAFRAKVPADLDFSLFVKGKRKRRKDMETRAVDISAQGMAFTISKTEQKSFKEDENINVQLIIDGKMVAKVNCTVRHISKIRSKESIDYNCGVQFDLRTRSIAAAIETIVATVQRAHLKELSDLSEESGLELIV